MFTQYFNIKIIASALMVLTSFSASALEVQTQVNPPRAIAKPDLVIVAVENNYYQESHKIRVVVRNNGTEKSGSAVLLGELQDGTKAEGTIIGLAPNHAHAVTLDFKKRMNRGDRLKFMADSKKHVDESNETNNTKQSNY